MTTLTIEHDAVKAYKQAVSNFNVYKKETNTELLNDVLNEYWNVIVNNRLDNDYFRLTLSFDYFSDYTKETLQSIIDRYKPYSKDCYYKKSTDSIYLKDEKITDVFVITLVHI